MGLTNLSPIIAKIQDQPNWYQRRLLLQITKQWSQIVGTAVSQQTRPTGIYRQVLQVAVANSAWSQALMFERRQILAKLQPYLNKEAITDIHFSTAKWQTMSKPIAIPELLEHHPSYIAPHQHPQFIQLPLPPTDALNALQRLTQLVKTKRRAYQNAQDVAVPPH